MADSTSSRKSPQACADLTELRAEIDRLDRDLVALLAIRTGYVARAAQLKKNRAAIVDQARIEQIIARVRSQATGHGVEPQVIEAIYRAMIAAFIAYEERIFDRDKD